MSPPIRLATEAALEVEEATGWYEERGGIGQLFLDATSSCLDLVARWPRAGALVEGLPVDWEVRRAPVAAFPYHVVYLVTDAELRVLAVAHDRRRPRYWTGRAT